MVQERNTAPDLAGFNGSKGQALRCRAPPQWGGSKDDLGDIGSGDGHFQGFTKFNLRFVPRNLNVQKFCTERQVDSKILTNRTALSVTALLR